MKKVFNASLIVLLFSFSIAPGRAAEGSAVMASDNGSPQMSWGGASLSVSTGRGSPVPGTPPDRPRD